MKSKLPWYMGKFLHMEHATSSHRNSTSNWHPLPGVFSTSARELAAGHNEGKRSERGNRLIERVVCPKTTFGQTTPNKGLFSALSLSFLYYYY